MFILQSIIVESVLFIFLWLSYVHENRAVVANITNVKSNYITVTAVTLP